MAIQELRTFEELQDAVILRARLDGTTTAIRNEVKEYINTFYQHLAFRKAYRWSGETMPLLLRAKYTTGTIAVTVNADTITGSSTSWTEFDHLWSYMKIGSEKNPFKIIRVASTTSITLDAPYRGSTASGVSYTIFRPEIGLFPDLHNIRKLMIPGTGARASHILPVGPEEFDRIRYRSPFSTGTPIYYTINGYAIYTEKTWATFNLNTDFWEDDYHDRPRNKKLMIWPAIVTTNTDMQIRYTKIPPAMDLDAEEPLVPYEMRRVLVLGPLCEWYRKGRDPAMVALWDKEYKAALKDMEADIETTDDELILNVDRRGDRRYVREYWNDDHMISSD